MEGNAKYCGHFCSIPHVPSPGILLLLLLPLDAAKGTSPTVPCLIIPKRSSPLLRPLHRANEANTCGRYRERGRRKGKKDRWLG